jgi:hypothetical protein
MGHPMRDSNEVMIEFTSYNSGRQEKHKRMASATMLKGATK